MTKLKRLEWIYMNWMITGEVSDDDLEYVKKHLKLK